ncbi:hypothetical protein ACTA71_012503 [Dictyostelium dimigraforme]
MKIINLILFILLINICYIKSQFILTDITPNNRLINYPQTVTESTCGIYRYILVSNATQKSSIKQLAPASFFLSSTPDSVLFSNYDYLNIGETKNVIFTVNDRNQSNGYLNVSYTCTEVDISLVTIDIIQNVTWSDNLKYSSIVRLNGVPDESTMPTNDNVILNRMGNSKFQIIFKESFYLNILPNYSNWEIDLAFTSNQVLKVSIPFNLSNPIVSMNDIKEYKWENLQFSSLSGGGIVFQSNSSIQRPIYSVLTVMNPYYLTPKPISGVKGNITYYVNPMPLMPGDQTFSFYSQNEDNSFKKDFNTTFNFQVTTPKPLGPSTVSFDNTTTSTFITVKFDGFSRYNFATLTCKFKSIFDYGFNYGFPFGFVGGNNDNNQMSISTPIPSKSFQARFTWGCGTSNVEVNETLYERVDSTNGKIISVEKINIYGFSFLVVFKAIDDSGVKYIDDIVNSNYLRFGSEKLVSGNIYNGVWEYIHDGVNLGSDDQNSLTLVNEMDYSTFYSPVYPFSPYNTDQILILPQIQLNDTVNYNRDIKDISFKFNNVHVTNQSVDNIMYFTFDNIENYKDLSIGFSLTDPKSLKDINFQSDVFLKYNLKYTFAKWDELNGRFSVMFKMPANIVPGVLDWTLTFAKYNTLVNTALPDKYQLNIISENIDIVGPVITKMVRKTPSDFGTSNIGWLLTIEDEINGLLNGYIIVRGSLDSSLYNFSISPSTAQGGSGDKWKADYLISIPIKDSLNNYGCIAQDYSISYARLVDSFGNVNKYMGVPLQDDLVNLLSVTSLVNPFYLFPIESLQISVDNTICNTPFDVTGPTLIHFISSKSNLDVGSQDRLVTFDFEAQDWDSGLKDNQFPSVYLINENLGSVECISTIVSRNSTNTIYTCTVEVPSGFGYPLGITVSVYGFINNGGYYSGFSSDLIKSMGFNSWFITTDQFSMDIPIIESSTSITNQGGDIWLHGRGLSLSGTVIITYFGQIVQSIPIVDNKYNSALLISGIIPTNQSFTIEIITSSQPSKRSNIITVIPELYFFNYTDPVPQTPTPSQTQTQTQTQTPTPTPSRTPTTPPTKSPIPTNPPQKCSGNPECGGPNQGVCRDNGCICIVPFYGKDCSSKLLEVIPPVINGSNPSVEIPIPGDNGASTTGGSGSNLPPQIIYKSLISIVSLRELDYNGNAIKTIPLNSWNFNEINSTISKYDTTLLIDDEKVNVTTTIQWFSKSSNVTFAGQQLIMNPSTLKFNVDITNYPFSSALNQLQLIMSATLISSSGTTNSDVCSSKSFGDTTNGDDSNFIKLQIDDHSVYGRFLKRAIVDGLIVSVDNVLLDDSMNAIESNTHAQQSFIGINIPHYSNLVSIDPDFSLLIDQHPASESSENSICSKKSGLTKGQIAGIAVGATGFATVVVVSIVYSVHKSKKNKKLVSSISKKLESIN